MTNIANQNRNKTKADEFEAIQLPAPDILRIRLKLKKVNEILAES